MNGWRPWRRRRGSRSKHIAQSHIRKEEIVANVLNQRGDHPGLVHILSAMEACPSYRPWHDKQTGKTFLRPDTCKCLHYYFYFMDAELGLVHLRVPTLGTVPPAIYSQRSQLGCIRQLSAEGLAFTASADNAFVRIDDWQRAQELADALSPDLLHRVLKIATRHCAVRCSTCSDKVGPLEPDAGRVRHGSGVPFRHHTEAAV